jgi:hypothetical protein
MTLDLASRLMPRRCTRLREIAPQLPVMFAGMADDATIRLTAGLAGTLVARDSVLHEAAARQMRVDWRCEPFQRT